MRKGLAALAAAAAMTVLAGCGGSPAGGPAACKAAMVKAYASAVASPGGAAASEPAACQGVPTATISRYATQIMGGGSNG